MTTEPVRQPDRQGQRSSCNQALREFEAPGKKYSKDLLRLNNSKIALRLVQSSGIKTARRLCKHS